MEKTAITLTLAFFAIISAIPSANAFEIFGFELNNIWENVKTLFGFNKEEQKEPQNNQTKEIKQEETPKPKNQNPTTTKTSQTETKPKEPTLTLSETTYTYNEITQIVNSKEEFKGYIKGFGYDCLFIKTDNNEQFTLHFDKEKGTISKIEKEDNCEKDIYFEESLINQINEEGFKASNIKSYLEKIDLPTTMYFKAIKVFTIG